jgi:hypothetical protein
MRILFLQTVYTIDTQRPTNYLGVKGRNNLFNLDISIKLVDMNDPFIDIGTLIYTQCWRFEFISILDKSCTSFSVPNISSNPSTMM